MNEKWQNLGTWNIFHQVCTSVIHYTVIHKEKKSRWSKKRGPIYTI